MKLKPRYLLKILALAGLYIIAAKLGLSLAFGVKQITTVWPPSGLALAALILYGWELWPGVLIGAFVANLLTNEPAAVAAGIAIGNALEAVIGAGLLRQLIDFRPQLNRVRGVLGLAILAAIFASTVAASVGTTSLALGGLISWGARPAAWLRWWFGDMAGILIFAPVILVWQSSWYKILKNNLAEFAGLIIATGVVTSIIFMGRISYLSNHLQFTYMIYPFSIWAAFRFKQLGVTAVSLLASIIAIIGTSQGYGPFARSGTPDQQLVGLLIFIILISLSGLLMAVAVLQRESSEQQLLIQAEELRLARDKITRELDAALEHESHLQDSNRRITGILSQLLGEESRRSNGHFSDNIAVSKRDE